MANKKESAVIQKVEDAEKIIQSNAYGADFDDAIAYLQERDPKNAVLAAAVKDFEKDIPTLKVLRALYRADEARAQNDTAELKKIAKFLSEYKAYENRAEAEKLLKDFPELTEEQTAAIQEIADETKKIERIHDKQSYVSSQMPSMSDDEIVANGEKICTILDEKFKWSDVFGEDDKITVIDREGKVLDAEKANEIKGLHRRWIELDAIRKHSDNAVFAAMDDKEKEATLKEDIYTRFWSDVETMAVTTAKLNGEDEKTAQAKARRHQGVAISEDVYAANREEIKENTMDKVVQLSEQKKEKAGSWLAGKLNKLSQISQKITGYTPVEFGKAIFSVFSRRRFAANVGVSMGSLGASGLGAASAAATIAGGAGLMAAAPAIAVAAAGVATYSLYSMYSQQRWSIWEKKHAYWKAAKAKGDAQEIARWSGMNGWNNALKAIKANPEENKIYEYTKKNNKRYGLLSGVLLGGATALVPGASALGRLIGGTTRAVGANQNAGFLYNLAKQKYAENKTEQNEINYKRARTGLILGLAGTTAVEAAIALNVSASDIGVSHNPENVDALTGQQHEAPAAQNNGNEAPVDASVEVTHADWREGISQNQANWIENHVQGKAAEYGKIYGWNVNPDNMEEVAQKMADNIQKAIDNGALPDKPVGEIMYKYLHLIAWREKGEYVSGELIQSTMVNGEPDYWTNATEIKALNHIIFCEEKPNVSSDALGNTLDRITASGDDLDKSLDHLTNHRYVGTADVMHKDGDVNCAHVSYWERVKGVVRHALKPADKDIEQPVQIEEKPAVDAVVDETPVVVEKTPVDNNVDSGVQITEKQPQDANVDDGLVMVKKHNIGRTDTGNDGQLNTTNQTSYARGHDHGVRRIPHAPVNLGREM